MRGFPRHIVVVAMAVVTAACAPAGPGASAPVATPAPEPVSASAQADGVIVTVSLSAGRVTAGDRVQVRVSVLNAGLGTVSWQSGGCELLNGYAIDGPTIPQPPEGRQWPDAIGLAKWSATTGGIGLEAIRSPKVPDGVAVGCSADLRIGEIKQGETASADAIWSARTTDGAPAPPGAYRVGYAFPLIGRVPAALVRDATATHSMELAVPLAVEGSPFAGIASTLAIDAALADARVAAWAAAHLTRERLAGAEIRLVDGRWRFEIRLMDERSTVVLIDPVTGRVDEVRLAD